MVTALSLLGIATAGEPTCHQQAELVVRGTVKDVYFLPSFTRVELELEKSLRGEAPGVIDFYLPVIVKRTRDAEGNWVWHSSSVATYRTFLPATGDRVVASLSRNPQASGAFFQSNEKTALVYATGEHSQAWTPHGFVVGGSCAETHLKDSEGVQAMTWEDYSSHLEACMGVVVPGCPTAEAGSYQMSDWKSIEREREVPHDAIVRSVRTAQHRDGVE